MKNLQISIEDIPESELKPKFESEDNLGFGQVKTDRMFTASFKDGSWKDLQIKKYSPIVLDPTAVCFHYGQTIFEGQKAFKTHEGHINLFRPEKNIARFNLSAKRMMMPEIDPEIYFVGLKKLIIFEKDWAPKSEGSTIYIRPAMIGTEPSIGLRASNEYLFFIVLLPSKAYYPDIMKIYVSEEYIRSAPGGMGSAKTGGNYGGSLFVGHIAKQKGFHAVLWLDAIHRRYVEEVGAMNIFFVLDDVVYTTPTDSNTIVHGITRDSAITILRDFGYTVKEESLAIEDVVKGIKSGSLTESFGTGTAASIAPVGSLYYQENDYIINDFVKGPITKKLTKKLLDIQYGRISDPYGWIVRVI